MVKGSFVITENTPVAAGIHRLTLRAPGKLSILPGQFVSISIPGFFLRRPFSVCDADDGSLTVMYRTVGAGTEALTFQAVGSTLDVMAGLGNGYDLTLAGNAPLLIGGGMGCTPLLLTAKALLAKGVKPYAVLGFSSKDDVILADELSALGCKVAVATVDGSFGSKGFVTDILPREFSYFYSCGPEAMYRAIVKATDLPGQFSFEERMGCGFGACMGCTKKTVNGFRRVCKDGPVFAREELLWED